MAATPVKQLTAFRLEADMLDAMRRLQRRDGISFSEQARRALRPWLEAEGVLKRRYVVGSATWRKLLNRAIEESEALQQRLAAFLRRDVGGQTAAERLDELRDIDARARVWAANAAGFVIQAGGLGDEPPDVDWDNQTHRSIGVALRQFLGDRHNALEKRVNTFVG